MSELEQSPWHSKNVVNLLYIIQPLSNLMWATWSPACTDPILFYERPWQSVSAVLTKVPPPHPVSPTCAKFCTFCLTSRVKRKQGSPFLYLGGQDLSPDQFNFGVYPLKALQICLHQIDYRLFWLQRIDQLFSRHRGLVTRRKISLNNCTHLQQCSRELTYTGVHVLR